MTFIKMKKKFGKSKLGRKTKVLVLVLDVISLRYQTFTGRFKVSSRKSELKMHERNSAGNI